MNQKRNKGFTLIELIGIIVILGVIAVIAVPKIKTVIDEMEKKAFLNSSYGLIKAANLYYSHKEMMGEDLENTVFEFPNNIYDLEIDGEVPEGGIMRLNEDGNVALAVIKDKYCVKKGYKDEDLTISENFETCEIPSILASENDCIKNTNSICPNGTAVNVQVNDTTGYKFYVIDDTGKDLVLILENNLGSYLAWNPSGKNSDGPRPILEELKLRVDDWTNIPEKEYTITDDGGGYRYAPVVISLRAKLPTKAQVEKVGCTTSDGSCPSYMNGNYWFTTADPTNDTNVYIIWNYATHIATRAADNHYNNWGIRPVITISKES